MRLTHVPNPTRLDTYPSDCKRSSTVTTVPRESPYWLAKSLEDGSLVPGPSRPSRIANRSSPYNQLVRVRCCNRLFRLSSNELIDFDISFLDGPMILAQNGSGRCTTVARILESSFGDRLLLVEFLPGQDGITVRE